MIVRAVRTLVKRIPYSYSLALAFLLCAVNGVPGLAQTWNESVEAYIARDFSTAYRGFKNHAERGNPAAQYQLGLMLYLDHGVVQDFTEAAAWYVRAAEQDDIDAQISLGLMYTEGRGVVKDHAEALHWYSRAAELNDPYGQYYVGAAYHSGRAAPKDIEKAVKWYRLSAEQGHTPTLSRPSASCTGMALASHRTIRKQQSGSNTPLSKDMYALRSFSDSCFVMVSGLIKTILRP